MKLIVIFIIVSGTLNSLKTVISTNNEPGFDFNKGLHSISSASSRPRRDENDQLLSTIVDRMQKVARITNGIYLTRGFITRTIPSDDFISELLRLGSITPSQLKSMDLTKLQTDLNSIKELSMSLTTSDMEEKIEQRYLVLDDIRKETADIGDIGEINEMDAYKQELNSLNSSPLDINKFKVLKTAALEFFKHSQELNKLPDEIPADDVEVRADATSNLSKLKKSVEPLKTASQDANGYSNFVEIQNSSRIFNPLSKILTGIEKVSSNTTIISKGTKDHIAINLNNENIGKMDQLGSLFMKVLGDVEKLRSIHEMRGQAFNGISDLGKTTNDFSSPWIRSLFINPSECDSLAKSMEQLALIGQNSEIVDSSIGTSDTKSLDEVLQMGNAALPFAQKSQTVLSAINKIQACKWSDLDEPKNMKTVKELLKNQVILQNKIDQLMKMKLLADFLTKNMEFLDEIFKLSTVPTTDPFGTIHNIVKQLKDSDGFQQVFKNLNVSIFEGLDEIEKSPTISELVTEIRKELSEIKEFQTNLPNFVKAFNCLQDVEDAESISSAIQILQKFRKITDSSRESIEKSLESVNNLNKATKELDKLKTVIDELHGFTSVETDALDVLPDPSQHSKTIGSATRGITSMQNAIDQRREFDTILKHVHLVQDELKSQKGQNLDRQNLQKLVGLDQKLKSMISELDRWKAGVKDPKTKKLSDYAEVFITAKTVAGIDDDLKILSDSVGKLAELVQNPDKLIVLQNSLNNLNSIGLKLSVYANSFSDSKKSLAALDLFFVDYSKKLVPTNTIAPPTQAQAQAAQPMESQKEVSSTIPAEGNNTNLYIYICVGCVVLCIVVSIVYCSCRYCGKGKEQQEAGKNQLSKKPKPVDTPSSGTDQPNKKLSHKLSKKKKSEKSAGSQKDTVSQKQKSEKSTFISWFQNWRKPTAKKSAEEPIKKDKNLYSKLEPAGSRLFLNCVHGNMLTYQENIGRKSGTVFLDTFFGFSELQFNSIANLRSRSLTKLARDYKSQNRWPIDLREETRVIPNQNHLEHYRIKNDYMHANYITLPNGNVIILLQAPIVKEGDIKGKLRTDDKLWYIVLDHKTNFVVMIGDFIENGEIKCGKYFPLEEGESITIFEDNKYRFTVTCTKKKNVTDTLIRRQLELKETVIVNDNEKKMFDEERKNKGLKPEKPKEPNVHYLDHLQYTGWPPGSVPANTDEIVKILAEIRGSNNAIVHCSNGIEASASIVCTEYGYQKLCERVNTQIKTDKVDFDYGRVMSEVNDMRTGAIQSPIQFACYLMSLIDIAVKDVELSKNGKRRYKELRLGYLNAIHLAEEKKTKVLKKKASEKSKSTKKTKPAKKTKPDPKEAIPTVKPVEDQENKTKKKKRAGDEPVVIEVDKTQDSHYEEEKTQEITGEDLV